MALFKSKHEKEIIAEMDREEKLNVFNDQIAALKAKREEYARIAAESEVNGDTGSYEVSLNSLLELNNMISSLTQMKANFDLINVANATATNMAMAVSALDTMASNKNKLPDIRQIQKANAKIAKYMREISISQKAMGSAMRTSNPANKARTQAEIDSVRPMIDAARSKMTISSMPKSAAPVATNSGMDLASEIAAEKNRII